MVPYYPDHVKLMFKVLQFVNMDISFISNMFTSLTRIDTLETEAYDAQFLDNGIDSPLFLQNCSSLLMSFLFTILTLVFLAVIYFIACCSRLKIRIVKILSSYHWNNCLRFVTEGYLELTFGAFLNVAARPMDNIAELISLIISITIFIPLFIFPFLTAALLYDKRKDITKGDEHYLKRYGTMYSDFKIDKEWYCFQYYPIFLLRRFIFVVFLILLIEYPEVQCNAFILGSMLVSCYQILCKPFKDAIINWLCIFNESILFMISLIQTLFIVDLNNVQAVSITGWLMISMVILMILLNFGVIVPYIIHSKWALRKKNRVVDSTNRSVASFTCHDSRFHTPS